VARRTGAVLLAVACLLTGIAIGLLIGWSTWHRREANHVAESNLSTCALSSLPAQATDTVRLIRSGGPFPHPHNDGVVFGNREAHLPQQGRGFYHEYTVPTPGAHNRGTRRIITGGGPATDPPQYFYTSDHYASFCEITGAGD
jgi:ribonuclease T1